MITTTTTTDSLSLRLPSEKSVLPFKISVWMGIEEELDLREIFDHEANENLCLVVVPLATSLG